MSRTNKNTERIVRLSMFTAIALTIFILEAQLPSPVIYIPGMKLGLANIVTLFLLATHKKSDAFMVLMVRIFLGSFFAGQMTALIYSLAGGILSFGAMVICGKLFGKENLWLMGIAGGVFHNIGQICAAAAVMQTAAVFSYLPALLLFGMAAGLFCGLTAGFFVRKMSRIKNKSQNQKKP